MDEWSALSEAVADAVCVLEVDDVPDGASNLPPISSLPPDPDPDSDCISILGDFPSLSLGLPPPLPLVLELVLVLFLSLLSDGCPWPRPRPLTPNLLRRLSEDALLPAVETVDKLVRE